MHVDQDAAAVAAATQKRVTAARRWGVLELDEEVRMPWTVHRAARAVGDARRTRERSVCMADVSGPRPAVQTGQTALRRSELATVVPVPIRVYLHASTYAKPAYRSTACFMVDQLSVVECAKALDVSAIPTAGAFAVDMAAGLLCGHLGLEATLITAGGRFGRSRVEDSAGMSWTKRFLCVCEIESRAGSTKE